MKLTTDTIENAPIIINPNKQVTLQLRNYRLTHIEYLPGNFDAIDLTNNQLIEVNPNTVLNQIKTLLLNNNTELYYLETARFPNLESLAVVSCNLKLVHMKSWHFSLHHLLILNNPVSAIKNYRLILIHLIPSLITLDGKKVNKSEREASEKLFEGKTIDDFVDSDIDNSSLLKQLKASTDINEIERLERLLT